jgi:hypothetical protein
LGKCNSGILHSGNHRSAWLLTVSPNFLDDSGIAVDAVDALGVDHAFDPETAFDQELGDRLHWMGRKIVLEDSVPN